MTDFKRSRAVKLGYERNPMLAQKNSARMKLFWSQIDDDRRREINEKISSTVLKKNALKPRKEPRLCNVEGCEKRSARKGMCQMHAWRLKHHGDVNHVFTSEIRLCSIAECGKEAKGLGMCATHYRRKKRGVPLDYVRPKLDTKRYILKTIHGHPLADKRGHVYLHRVVLFDSIGWMKVPCFWCGRRVSFEDKSLIVDHLNHDRHDYSLHNLLPSCVHCNAGRTRANSHIRTPIYMGTVAPFPVGEDGDFVWFEMNGTIGPKVGT